MKIIPPPVTRRTHVQMEQVLLEFLPKNCAQEKKTNHLNHFTHKYTLTHVHLLVRYYRPSLLRFLFGTPRNLKNRTLKVSTTRKATLSRVQSDLSTRQPPLDTPTHTHTHPPTLVTFPSEIVQKKKTLEDLNPSSLFLAGDLTIPWRES